MYPVYHILRYLNIHLFHKFTILINNCEWTFRHSEEKLSFEVKGVIYRVLVYFWLFFIILTLSSSLNKCICSPMSIFMHF